MSTIAQLPDDARDVLISVNPRAGARDRQPVVEELRRQLAESALQPVVVTDIDALSEQARLLLERGRLRAIVAAGGDGTLRLVAERTPPGTPLAILPLGTENLLARYLNVTADAGQLTRIICDGLTGRFDAGDAGGRLFTLMAGCGFDADVVRRLHGSRKGHIQHLSYAKPILDAIRTYDYPELRVHYLPVGPACRAGTEAAGSDDLPPKVRLGKPDLPAEADAEPMAELTARWVFVVNLPRYAGGLSFAPRASGTDGLLDVCTFKEGSLWYGLMYLGGVVLGQHQAMQDFVHVQTRRLRIEASSPVPYQLDGDPGGDLPVDIRAVPGRLTLLVARSWAVKEGLMPADSEPAKGAT